MKANMSYLQLKVDQFINNYLNKTNDAIDFYQDYIDQLVMKEIYNIELKNEDSIMKVVVKDLMSKDYFREEILV